MEFVVVQIIVDLVFKFEVMLCFGGYVIIINGGVGMFCCFGGIKSYVGEVEECVLVEGFIYIEGNVDVGCDGNVINVDIDW